MFTRPKMPVVDNKKVVGDPILSRLDGQSKARLSALSSKAFTDADRSEYGLYLVDTTPPEGKIWTGAFTGTPPAPVFADKQPPTIADVAKERAKRLAAGFDYDFGDERGVHRIGTSQKDMEGWDEVTTGANAAVALGSGSTEFEIVTETGPVTVTALEWQSILLAATAFRQPIWTASFAIQQMDPIPDPATWGGWP